MQTCTDFYPQYTFVWSSALLQLNLRVFLRQTGVVEGLPNNVLDLYIIFAIKIEQHLKLKSVH